MSSRDVRRALRDVLVNGLAASGLGYRPLRHRLLRGCGVEVAPGANIGGRCWFGHGRVRIGTGSWVNYGVWFDSTAGITLGRWVYVGPQVLFVTGNHEIGGPGRRAGRSTHAPITVGDGTWIGARATVLPGVTIGAGCLIAAGAVVTRDCAPHGMYAGVPARRIKDLPLDEPVDPSAAVAPAA